VTTAQRTFEGDAEAFFQAFYLRTPGARAVYWDSIRVIAALATDEHSLGMLDVGCGAGHLLRELGERAPLTLGVDRSRAMTGVARRLAPAARLVMGVSEHLPFRDASVDVVLSRAHLQHVDDLASTLGECTRVLRPGGRLIVFVPVTNAPTALARAVAIRLVPARREVSGSLRSRREYRSAMERAGLRLMREEAYGGPVYALSGYGTGISLPLLSEKAWRVLLSVDRFLLRLPVVRNFGINLLAVAQKPLRA
jgi:ubiquinone/menaquinone biosynthesis C-methylase UbiE